MRSRALAVAAALSLAGGLTLLVAVTVAGTAQAAASCPTVAGDGTVTPAPSADVDWSGCDLTGANLADSSLSDADLSDANLTDANLSDASLYAASITGANLAGANLTGTTLTEVTSGSLSGTPADLPANWEVAAGYLIGPEANLSAADLAGADLSGADFTSANLSDADLHGADISDANFTSAILVGVESGDLACSLPTLPDGWSCSAGFLIGPGANLAGANLTLADMYNADIAEADLEGADLAGDNLWNSYAFDTDFTDANLTGANLTGDILTGAILAGTKLAGANLDEVESGGTDGTAASLPTKWFQLGGFLFGPDDNLANDELAGLNLTGADLAGSQFGRADLTGVNFTDADLSGSSPYYATVTGVTWSNTICPDGTNSDSDGGTCASDLEAAPYANPTFTGNLGTSGWYISPVTVQWNWTDGGTAISKTACTTTSASSDQGRAVTLSASCANVDGDVGRASVTLMIDTTPPTVAVTGVSSKHQYVIGQVPAVGCKTADSVSGVATPAMVKVTTSGSHGTGTFTATCTGALDVAGIPQAAPVAVTYTVVYGFSGFAAPKPKSTLSKSGTITVEFRLSDARGTAIAPSLAAALASAGRVRATLSGPGISAVTAECKWNTAKRAFQCIIKLPHTVRTGMSHPYRITATENLGAGSHTAPAVSHAVDPEVIYFR
jgi:uncharacterized protein YjbI with pentapeptide repeats